MGLGDRLRNTTNGKADNGMGPLTDLLADPAVTNGHGDSEAPRRPSRSDDLPRIATDPFRLLKDRAQEALFARLGNRLYDASLDQQQLNTLVSQELTVVLESEPTPLTGEERQRLVREITEDVLGYGPIESLLSDETVTEIMVNGSESIYVERNGRLEDTGSRYLSDGHVRQVIERIVAQVGRRIDESSPMVDARLADGSRVNAIVPPLAVDGPTITIRKFAKQALTMDDLVEYGSISPTVAELVDVCVLGKLNVLISGGTGSGKTTLLNICSSYIPDDERIVTIEDAVELRLQQEHVVRLESRPPNIEGKGAVTIRDLVRNALRMRPDRIVVGEVRGPEALDMLQAMNTGHEGSLSTLHANSPRDALSRLETMVLTAGVELPVRAIREQIASAIDVIVQISRLRDGSRRVVRFVEVNGLEGDVITLSDLFTFDYAAGTDEDGRFVGTLRPTGLRPTFADKLSHSGVQLPTEMFQEAPLTFAGRGGDIGWGRTPDEGSGSW